MPTIDDLNQQLKLQQVTTNNYNNLATEYSNDKALQNTLNKLKEQSNENVSLFGKCHSTSVRKRSVVVYPTLPFQN